MPGEKLQVWLDDTIAGTNGLAIDNKGNLIVSRQLDGAISTNPSTIKVMADGSCLLAKHQ